MPKVPVRFTEATVSRLQSPATGEAVYWDALLPGFGLRVSQSGRKTWIANVKGSKRRLGHYPDMSVADARASARLVLADGLPPEPVEEPDDPEPRAAMLFADLAEQFLEHGLSRRGKPLRPASAAAYRIVLRRYAAPLHKRPVDTIRRRDIAELLRVIARDSGGPTASLARSVLSRFFGYLCEVDLVEHHPADRTPVFAIEPRSRVFSDVELAALWHETEGAGDFNLLVRICLWTGCRRSEAGGMRWSELQDGVWTIPGSRTKNHRALTLPLPGQAREALAAHPRVVGRDHLFGSTSQAGFKSWVQKDRLAVRLGFARRWSLHDCRRLVETKMSALGISREVITRALNHGVPTLQRTYDHHDYGREIGGALQLWADELARITAQPLLSVTGIKSRSAKY
jgi:integrase